MYSFTITQDYVEEKLFVPALISHCCTITSRTSVLPDTKSKLSSFFENCNPSSVLKLILKSPLNISESSW